MSIVSDDAEGGRAPRSQSPWLCYGARRAFRVAGRRDSRARRVLTVLVAGAVLALTSGASTGSAHACVKSDELWFRAADGTKLVGHRFGGKRPGARTTVVLAHMSVGDLCQWAPYARNLASKGLFVFPFDFRGHGFSEGSENHSRAAVRRIRMPTVYVAAEQDQNPPYDFTRDVKTLYEATATPAKRLEVVPGSLHGTFVAGSAAVRMLLLAFARDPRAAVR